MWYIRRCLKAQRCSPFRTFKGLDWTIRESKAIRESGNSLFAMDMKYVRSLGSLQWKENLLRQSSMQIHGWKVNTLNGKIIHQMIVSKPNKPVFICHPRAAHLFAIHVPLFSQDFMKRLVPDKPDYRF